MEQAASPRVEEYTPPPKPRILNAKFLWLAVAGVVVVAGIFGYRFYQSLPFRVKDDRIILRDSHGGSITIDTSAELPDTFPEDIPIFPDAVLQPSIVDLTSQRNPDQEGSLYMWQAPAPLEDVGFWYNDALAQNGWEVPLKTPTQTSVLYTVRKGDRGFVMEIKGVSSTRTDVSIILTEEFEQ